MTHDELVRLAVEARRGAWAPYSKYRVGAAVLAADGRVFTGANVENASYGLTVCAERIAIFKAVNEGARELTTIAVATESGASMCGACRQVAAEFNAEVEVLLADTAGVFSRTSLAKLLPGAFELGE